MSKETARFRLPFAVLSKDRRKAFTDDMEKAAIFCLADTEREKGGLILKKPSEELVFVAEAYYPLWVVPWKDRNLLFDGLNVAKYTPSYDVLPDIQDFVNQLQGSAKTREAYSAFLSDHLNYFRDFKGEKEEIIEGLIATPDLLRDLPFYLQETKPVRAPMVNRVILSSTLDESTIEAALSNLSKLHDTLEVDAKSLRKAMELVNAKTGDHVKVMRGDLQKVKEEFDQKIVVVKASVMEKTRQIQEKYDKRITELSQIFEPTIRDLHQERAKAEKAKEHVLVEMERCKAEMQSSKMRKDEPSEVRWRQEMEKYSKELSALDKALKDLNKKIDETTGAKDREIANLRVEYNTEANKATEELRELEASYEAENSMRQQEIQKLEDMSSTIIKQIDRLLELKRAKLKDFGKMGMPKKRQAYALVHLPFYLACYERELKRRYVIYPPSLVGGMGVLTRFKGVFGAAKIKSLLEPRSKALTNHLNQLINLILNNPVFEKEVGDAGVKANILRTKASCKCIKRGLEKLKGEEWISENDFQALSQLLQPSRATG